MPVFGSREQEHGLDFGREVAVRQRHLALVLQVRRAPHSAHDGPRSHGTTAVDDETVEHGHDHAVAPLEGTRRFLEQGHPLFAREHLVLVGMLGNGEGHTLEDPERPLQDVQVPERDGIERAREQSVTRGRYGHRAPSVANCVSAPERSCAPVAARALLARPPPPHRTAPLAGPGVRTLAPVPLSLPPFPPFFPISLQPLPLPPGLPCVRVGESRTVSNPGQARSLPWAFSFVCGAVVVGSALGPAAAGPLFASAVLVRVAAWFSKRQRGRHPPAHFSRALVFAGLAALGVPIHPSGHFTLRSAAGDELRGRISGLQGDVLVARGSAAPGERLLVIGVSDTRLRARCKPAAEGAAEVAFHRLHPDELERVAPARASRLACAASGLVAPVRRARAAALERLGRLHHVDTRTLAQALAFGEREGLSADLSERFTRTGTRHMLALSGLHVGLVAWMLALPLGAWIGRLLRVRPALPRALLVLAFVPLGGASAPVTRAGLALALALAATRVPPRGRPLHAPGPGRAVHPPTLFALALACEALVDPHGLAELGVLLSYAATAGLLASTAGMAHAVAAWLPGRALEDEVRADGRRRPPWLRALALRTRRATASLVGASCVAVVATLPITWSAFGEASPIGVLATALALPACAALIAGAWTFACFPSANPAWVELPAQALALLLAFLDRWPATPVPLPPRPTALVTLACVLTLIHLARRARPAPARPSVWARTAAALGGVLLLPWTRGAVGLELAVLDVGHGTACVLRAPGAPTVIFDAGSSTRLSVARSAVAPILRRWDVGPTLVVLSHPDRDHAAALPWVAARWPPRAWWGAEGARSSERWSHVDLAGPGSLDARMPGGLTLTLVRGSPGEGNEGSRSLVASYGGTRVLLSGDAEGEGLVELAARLPEGPLRVPLATPPWSSAGGAARPGAPADRHRQRRSRTAGSPRTRAPRRAAVDHEGARRLLPGLARHGTCHIMGFVPS